MQADTTGETLLVDGKAGTHMRVGATGHQNVPPQAREYVTRAANAVLGQLDGDLVGVSSLAAGGDQIFASLVLEQGGRLEVVLPCKGYETTFSSPEDLRNFHALLERAATVETLGFDEPSEDAYLAAGCRVVDLSEMLLAIWDGQPARGKGGTGDVVEYARRRGVRLEIVWPKGIVR